MKRNFASAVMDAFAEATGISGQAPPRRYLWTDAFAVCNFLGLYRSMGDEHHLTLARRLVDQVHHVLGRHREDDLRYGWISGLREDLGAQHPTMRGLRIGKPLPERKASESYDPTLEWNRDGQYFHYLTKWAHALCRMEQETGDADYGRWASELMTAAHRAFTFGTSPGRPKRMVWKMSIDLARPLVSSMGHHDPLDGLIACLESQQVTKNDANEIHGISLVAAVDDMTAMCKEAHWATDDPLGIGGLLDAAARLAQQAFLHGAVRHDLLLRVLVDAEESLRSFARTALLDRSADERLAFRELGLAIGLRGLDSVRTMMVCDDDLAVLSDRVLDHLSLAERIESYWTDPAHQGSTWTDHGDINSVMLATALKPDGYFGV